MKPMIQLHLEIDSKKPEASDLPMQERKEPEPVVTDERLNRILRRAAHKAGTEFRHGGSGIFSK